MAMCLYDTTTGLFIGQTIRASGSLPTLPEHIGWKEGQYSCGRHRVNLTTGEVEEYRPPAPQDGDLVTWSWDESSWRWVSQPTDLAVAAEVRARRDALLAASDWTQLADAPLADDKKRAWAEYRRALRQIPQTVGFPRNVAWPEEP